MENNISCSDVFLNKIYFIEPCSSPENSFETNQSIEDDKKGREDELRL